MELSWIDRLFISLETPRVQLKSTSLSNDSRFNLLLDAIGYDPLCSGIHRTERFVALVSTADRLLSLAEKNGMLRSFFARNIEDLIQSTLRLYTFEWRHALVTFFTSDTSSWEFARDLAECLKCLIALFLGNFSSGLGFTISVLVSAIVLSIVFQYLVGYVDKGGTKTYNPGSLEFRATYVSLLLFLGAYVWIKFRDGAAKRTVYQRLRPRRDEAGQDQVTIKYEPRFKPPREKGILNNNYLPLGTYDTEKDAKIVCQIAGFYFGKDVGVVAEANESPFYIPAMSVHERSLCGEKKREWVSAKAREVFELYQRTAAREQPRLGAHAGDQVEARGLPSADRAAGLSAHIGDQPADAPGSPSADRLAAAVFPAASTNGNDEFVERLSTLTWEHGPLESVGDEESLLDLDIPMPTFEEKLKEQLHLQKKKLEADFNRRLESLTEQHQVELSELRQENKRLKTIIQQAAETSSALLRKLQY